MAQLKEKVAEYKIQMFVSISIDVGMGRIINYKC